VAAAVVDTNMGPLVDEWVLAEEVEVVEHWSCSVAAVVVDTNMGPLVDE